MPTDVQTVFTISEGDTYPPLRVKAFTTDDSGNEIVLPNLLGATVKFSMVNEVEGAAFTGLDAVNGVVESSITGVLRMTFDGSQRAGVYWGDFDVLHGNGDKSTVPNNGRKVKVIVTRSAIAGD